MKYFSDKTVGEIIPLGFDFVLRLDKLETIESATFSIFDVENSLLTITNMLPSAANISGSQVKTMVQNGILGHTYELTCSAVTSGGKTLCGKARFKVV